MRLRRMHSLTTCIFFITFMFPRLRDETVFFILHILSIHAYGGQALLKYKFLYDQVYFLTATILCAQRRHGLL